MHKSIEVLLASRSKAALEDLASKLGAQGRYRFRTRHIENGHSDPLWGLSFVPDVVVMLLNEQGHHDLAALTEEQSAGRPPLIVLAKQGDAQTMRLAMQAGARDFLPGAVTVEDLLGSIERVSAQLVEKSSAQDHRLTAFVNAKGGSGATFIACNVAHISQSVSGHPTALMSLDLQFESLAQYLDTELRHGLVQVLDSVETLDAVALDAYLTHHKSGLRMLAAQPEDGLHEYEDRSARLGSLLDKMVAQYEHVVVDIPRRVDSYGVQVFERADRLVLVVQQTLGHLHDASRMLQIFRHYGVRREQILVVVNRFEKNAPVTTDDIRRALQGMDLAIVPSDFKTVSESINLGLPIHEHAKGSAVTKALLALETQLGGRSAKAQSGFLSKTFGQFLRK